MQQTSWFTTSLPFTATLMVICLIFFSCSQIGSSLDKWSKRPLHFRHFYVLKWHQLLEAEKRNIYVVLMHHLRELVLTQHLRLVLYILSAWNTMWMGSCQMMLRSDYATLIQPATIIALHISCVMWVHLSAMFSCNIIQNFLLRTFCHF